LVQAAQAVEILGIPLGPAAVTLYFLRSQPQAVAAALVVLL